VTSRGHDRQASQGTSGGSQQHVPHTPELGLPERRVNTGLHATATTNGIGSVYRARYYDPAKGRFISEDPIGFLSGTTHLYSYPRQNPINFLDPFGLAEFIGRGLASWYGPGFEGKPTASGQPFDPQAMTGASRDLPLGTTVEVQHDGKSVEVTINDRGPYHRDQDGQYDRIIDLSQEAFRRLADSTKPGLIEVEIHKTGYQKITRPPRSSNRNRSAQPQVKVPCPPISPDPLQQLGPFAP